MLRAKTKTLSYFVSRQAKRIVSELEYGSTPRNIFYKKIRSYASSARKSSSNTWFQYQMNHNMRITTRMTSLILILQAPVL